MAIGAAGPGAVPSASDRPARRSPGGGARVRVGELISAGSGLALLIVMFALAWYGVAGVPDPSYARPAVSGTEDAWSGLTVTRWVLLVTVLAAVGTVILHISQRGHGTKTDTSRLVATLGALSSALLVYRVLIVLPGGGDVIDQKLGAVLGLVCAFGIAWGGWESIQERRARDGNPAPRARGRPRIVARRGTR